MVHVPIPRFGAFFDSINDICLRLMPRVVETDFNLVVQSDGFAVNAATWDDRFLAHDYIGAPWAAWERLPRYEGQPLVGNGGFSLRNRRLYAALRAIEPRWDTAHWQDDPRLAEPHHTVPDHTLPGRPPAIPEDVLICLWYRDVLERSHGIRFCDPDLAMQFSVETITRATRPWLGRSFGFHGARARQHYAIPTLGELVPTLQASTAA